MRRSGPALARVINGGDCPIWPRRRWLPGRCRRLPALDQFIDRKLGQYGLTEADLAIVGFSQGTMMALHVGLRRPRQIAGIVGYSGMLTGADALRHEHITKPPVLLVHGSQDPVVPVAALHAAAAALNQLGIAVSTHIAPGLDHSVDPDGLRLGREFIGRALAAGDHA